MPDNLDPKRIDALDKTAPKAAAPVAPETVTMRVARGRTVHLGTTVVQTENGKPVIVDGKSVLVDRVGKHTFGPGEQITLPVADALHLTAAGFLQHDRDAQVEDRGMVTDTGPLSIHQKAR